MCLLVLDVFKADLDLLDLVRPSCILTLQGHVTNIFYLKENSVMVRSLGPCF